jgi:hypothetical protein
MISVIAIASTIGSGSSGGSGGAPPIATINFPPPVSSTNASTITVTGTASDETGVASVSVNGKNASSTDGSTDGFTTWRVTNVPLVPGRNTLTVSTVDTLGIADSSAATAVVTVAADLTGFGTQFADGYAVALDSSRAFVSDFDSDELVAVNIDTGSTTGISVIISSATTGMGPDFDGPGGTVLVNGLTAVLVVNYEQDELLNVDLVSGNRAIVSDSTTGMGPILFGPIGLALVDATSALVTNNATDELMSVDLTNGNRSVVSAFGVGTGPEFIAPEGVTMDSANNRALVTDSLNNSLTAVTLADGNRTIISANANPTGMPPTPEVGTGPNFDYPIGVVLDNANNRALVVNNFSNLIIAVDLLTGDRTVFSNANTIPGDPMAIPPELPAIAVGTGPALDFASGIALDSKDSAFVSGDKLWAVELGSGDRVIVGD